MNLNQIIVKGKFIVPYEKEKAVDMLNKVKDAIMAFLKGEGYIYSGPTFPFYNFLSIHFTLYRPGKLSFFDRFKSQEEQKLLEYLNGLKTTRNEIPFKIIVNLYLGKYKEAEGVIVEVISQPALYFKITQKLLPLNYSLTETERSAIIFENTQFIKRISHAFHGYIIEEPKPLDVLFRSEVTEKLQQFGYRKISYLLEESYRKMETGQRKEAIDDLRGVIENFLYQLVKSVDITPKGRHQPEKNLELLYKQGYLDDQLKGLFGSTLVGKVYKFLTDKHHKRENLDLLTLRTYYRIVESCIDSLLEIVHQFGIRKR